MLVQIKGHKTDSISILKSDFVAPNQVLEICPRLSIHLFHLYQKVISILELTSSTVSAKLAFITFWDAPPISI